MKFYYFYLVRKVIATLLFSIYLLSSTELYQILKVNVLIEHFYETQQKDTSVSLARFLIMHYITDDGNDSDNARDSQLPFKSNSIITHGFAVFILNKPEEVIVNSICEIKADFNNYHTPFSYTSFCDMVWNPPQIS